ncbi:MAG: hypothetical protein DMD35_09260 [Gemmatimonadetes bacterium]|nr:MAG: hypothetical protein DMD35_09260 [Gemmatimonadota bacterium]
MVLVTVLTLTMPACSAHAPSRTAAHGVVSIGDVVTQEELVASGASSVYDALMRTRRQFFTSRGVSSLSNAPTDGVLVFRGGAIMGTLDVLNMLRPSDVRAVRHIGVTETYHRYGQHVAIGGLEVELVNDR